MFTKYESSDDQTMDEQSGEFPSEINNPFNKTSMTTASKKISSLSYQGSGDDSDIPNQSRGATISTMFSTTRQDEGSQYTSEESFGEDPITVGGTEGMVEAAELNEEIGNPEGQESGEEYFEATPEQLQAGGEESGEESGEEGLFDTINGLFGSEAAEMMEAGTAIEHGQETSGQEEFFPFLAALVPTLISSIGPAVAKKVIGKLSPIARRGVKRLAAGAIKKAGKKISPVRNILGTFARLLETTQDKPSSESGAEMSEELTALINEAAATMEVIIGTDDRKRVENTSSNPWRRICALRITFPSGQTYRGTGFFVGPRAVITAGHCVYLHNQGGWARKVEVIPGANGALQPYGAATSTTFRSVRGWVNGKKPEHDYGCVVLPAGSFGGRNLGKFGFASFDSKALLARSAILSGYPGDKPFAEMWGMKRRIKIATTKTLVYDIDTVGGQSGAPVYIKRNGKRYVVGIHNYGNSAGNSATRITPPVFDRLKKWSIL